MRGILSCFIFLALFCYSSRADSISRNYILVINSYGNDLKWSKGIEDAFHEELIKHFPTTRVCNEYLNAYRTSDPNVWLEAMEIILKHYSDYPPKIVVLIADPAWMTYRQAYKGQFGQVNVLLGGVKKWGLNWTQYKNKKPLESTDFELTENSCKQYNATGIIEKLYVDETLQLIQALQPETDQIAVISDNHFYGQYTILLIQKYLQEKHTSLQFIPLNGLYLTTDSLYQELSRLSPSTGILFGSWLLDATEKIYTYPEVYQKISEIVKRPIFVLNDWGEDKTNFTGGYYSPSYNYGKELAGMACQLLSGETISRIPVRMTTAEASIYLNYAQLRQYKLHTDPISDQTIYYYNVPPGFFERHETLLLLLISVFVGIGILVIVFSTRARFLFYREKLDNSQSEINTSVSNQEHLADALKIFLQEKTEKDSVYKILQRMLNEMKADRTYIFEIDEHRQTHSNTYEVCAASTKPQIASLQNIPNTELPWLCKHLQEDKLLIIENLSNHSDIPLNEREILMAQGIKTLLISPLHVYGRLWGYVGLDYVSNVKYCEQQDLLYLKNLAQIICIGIEHYRSEERNIHSLQRVAELEALFSYASSQANAGFAQWDPLTHSGFATEQWFENLAETSQEKQEGIGKFENMHPDDRKAINDYIERSTKEQVQPIVREVRIQTPAGWHWYKYHISPWAKYTHQNGLVFLSVDIDNLKKTEDSLRKAKAKAEESDKLKSAFIANMSHEIRTPLNAIVGFSKLLVSDNNLKPEEKEEFTRIVKTNNDLLLQLVNDILDMSKIEAGVMNFSQEIIELNAFCQEIEAVYIHRTKPDVEIKFIPPSLQEYALSIDKTRLNQVISNLINNAIKFTDRGYIHFGYAIRDKEIYFYVTDTGIGIQEENQKDIFHRFVKLNSFAQGTGLGLSICSTIIEKFGGEIGVQSKTGQGSTFWFTLPR